MLYILDHDVFCEILVQRPVSRSSTYLPSHMTKEDLKHMQYMAQKHFDKIMQVLKDMPRPIILIIRLVFYTYLLYSAHFAPFCWMLISLYKKEFNLHCKSPSCVFIVSYFFSLFCILCYLNLLSLYFKKKQNLIFKLCQRFECQHIVKSTNIMNL